MQQLCRLGVVLLLALPAAARADGSLRLPVANEAVWEQLESVLSDLIAEDWREGLKGLDAFLRHKAVQDTPLLPAPRPRLVETLAGMRALLDALKARPLRHGGQPVPAADFDPKTAYQYAPSMLAWLGEDPTSDEVKAIARAIRKSFKTEGGNPTAEILSWARQERMVRLLQSKYGLRVELADIGRMARARKRGAVALLKALHERYVGPPGDQAWRLGPHYVSARMYVEQLLAELPAEGRAAYRDRTAIPARRRLARARPDHRAPLEDLLRDYPGLTETALALDRLAEWELADGRPARALERWLALGRWIEGRARAGQPAGEGVPDRAGVLARQATAYAALGRVEAIERLIVAAQAGGKTLAGKPVAVGTGTRTLAEHLEEARKYAASGAASGTTVALRGIIGQRWSLRHWQGIQGNRSYLFGGHFARGRVGLDGRYPIDYQPLVTPGGRVIVRSSLSAAVVDLASGKVVGRSVRLTNAPFALNQSQSDVIKIQKRSIPEGYYGTLSGSLYFASYLDVRRNNDDPLPTTTLVCMEADAPNMRVAWCQPPKRTKRQPTQAQNSLQRAVIGTVLAANDELVFAGVTTVRGDVNSYVYAFDRETGDIRWHRYLCGRSSNEAVRYPSPVVALRGPTLYVGTGQGVAAALDADSGQVRWLYEYGIAPEELSLTSGLGGRPRFENRWWLQPPRLIGDRFLLPTTDTARMYVFDAARGTLDGDYPPRENAHYRYLVGPDREGKLLLGGRHMVRYDPEGKPSRTLAHSQLIYDDDDEGQLTRWRLHEPTWDNTETGRLQAEITRMGSAIHVKLYGPVINRQPKLVARGVLHSGRKGAVRLSAVGGSGLAGSVHLNYKRDVTGARRINVHTPVGLVGRPVMTRDHVLVPTPARILLLHARTLESAGYWSGRALPEYALGNLSVHRIGGGPPLLLLASRQRLVCYTGRAGK